MSDKFVNENGVQAIKTYIDKKYPPIMTQGNYKYRIYDDGTFEVWFTQVGFTTTINNASGTLYRSPLLSLALPSALYNSYTCTILHAEVNCSHNNYPSWGMLASIYSTGVNYYAMSGGSRGSSPNYTLTAYIFGTLS